MDRSRPPHRPFGRIPPAVPFVLLVLVCGAGAALDRSSVPVDLILFAEAATAALTGDLRAVYADAWMQAGPWELLGSLVVLPLPHQHHPAYQTAPEAAVWIGAVRFGLGAGLAVVLLGTVHRLRRSHRMPTAAWPLLGMLALGMVFRLPWLSVTGGHLAQPAIAFSWLLAAGLAARGRSTPAAVLLGLACGWEVWAVLGAPVLLCDPRLDPRRPRRAVLAGLVLVGTAVAVYLPFVLSGPFALFQHEWFLVRDTVVGMVLPKGAAFGWPLRLLQSAGTVLAASAVALALRPDPVTRRDGIWLVPFTVQLVRLLLDPLDLGYYWFPLLALGLVGVGMLPYRPDPALPWTRWPGRVRVYLVSGLVVLPNLASLVPGQTPPSRLSTALLVITLLLVPVVVAQLRRDAAAAAASSGAPSSGAPLSNAPSSGPPGVPVPRAEPVVDGVPVVADG